ncbi:MAG TPA: hypothetical protein DCQ92_16360 [Verrucomicrobia subdivision 3 bacterium]|nr:hypothetical protein [Limisphaerales bacterium]
MFKSGTLDKTSRWAYILFAVAGWILAVIKPLGAYASTEGLYVGQDFYAPGTATQDAARSSGFTRLFLFALHVNTNGDIAYTGF